MNETTGRTLGTVQADSEGRWALAIEARGDNIQSSPDLRLSIGDTVSAVVVDRGITSKPVTAEVTQELAYVYGYSGGSASYLSTFFAGADGTFSSAPARSDLDGSHAGKRNFAFTDLADINGDKILDYVSGVQGRVKIAYGQGDGTFADDSYVTPLPTANTFIESSHLTDFNGDGLADYVFIHHSDGKSFVEAYQGQGDKTFIWKARTTVPDILKNGVNSFVRMVDMNGDGRGELVVGDEGTVQVLKGNADGTFSGLPVVSELPTGSDYHKSTLFGDFDGDGLVDYLYSHQDRATGETRIQVFKGLSAEGSFSEQSLDTVLPAGGEGQSWGYARGRVADIDQDGTLDYLAEMYGALEVFSGQGDGTFSSTPDETLLLPFIGSIDESAILSPLHMDDIHETLTGSWGADTLDGTEAAERIVGRGGRDRIDAGDGDDVIFLPDLEFAQIDGGEGIDTIILTDGGHTLDLTGSHRDAVRNVDNIDLSGNGPNTLKMSPETVLDSGITRVFGEADDSVHLAGFVEDTEYELGGYMFDVYTDGASRVSIAQEVGEVVT